MAENRPTSDAVDDVRALHRSLVSAWNDQDADSYGALFAADARQVGFDGSQVTGANHIRAEVARIFADHKTGQYVTLVREVRLLAPTVAVLAADAGLVPAGADDIKPELNAVQSLVAVRGEDAGGWRVALYQNTPAQLHGRPEASEALTAELRAAARGRT
jgi:uncharacterized protein (TIGR02246 family)